MSSMPSEMRANPSATGSPQRARRSTDVWMPPKLVAATSSALRSHQRVHRGRVGQFERHQAAEPPHLRQATSWAGSSGSPG